jgi:hypothetical protein
MGRSGQSETAKILHVRGVNVNNLLFGMGFWGFLPGYGSRGIPGAKVAGRSRQFEMSGETPNAKCDISQLRPFLN